MHKNELLLQLLVPTKMRETALAQVLFKMIQESNYAIGDKALMMLASACTAQYEEEGKVCLVPVQESPEPTLELQDNQRVNSLQVVG